MRIAFISDIHGNHIALEAVLSDIRKKGVDSIVCLGDLATLGTQPREAVDQIRDLKIPCVKGNHESFLIDRELAHGFFAQNQHGQAIIDSIDWCRTTLQKEDLAYLDSFPMMAEFPLENNEKITCFHGIPASNMIGIFPETPLAEVAEALMNHNGKVYICGHTHIQMAHQYEGALVVNAGSVGLPFKRTMLEGSPQVLNHAEYCLITITKQQLSVELCQISVDTNALINTLKASTLPIKRWLINSYETTLNGKS